MKPFARALIITADDFGLHQSVNEAIEQAHRDGVLKATSLMVGAPCVADAVARAQRLPGLRVGLHLVLADGSSSLPAARIPDLVDASGRFKGSMFGAAVRIFFLPRVRRQLALEIRAQFEAGLALDHVNTHKHFHLHPTILGQILEIGREFELAAMRLPREAHPQWFLRPWLGLVRRRLSRAAIRHNDYVVGIRESGRFDEATLLEALAHLPAGVGEIYLHPALDSGERIAASMRGYRHADELAALCSPRVRSALEVLRLAPIGFSDLGVRP
jgi:hopanoid biosynthesis associated protein HpnK